MFDQYSLLHFAAGVSAYFWGVKFGVWLLLHTIFEIYENTEFGMYITNTYIKMWPGGKPAADSLENTIGDTISAVMGWLIAYWLDRYGKKYKWYSP